MKDARAFRGLVGYYRIFITGSGKTTEPFYTLMNKTNNIEWSTECKSAATELKKKPLEAQVLGYPNNRDPYTSTTDASLTAIGAFSTQKEGTDDRIIAYVS